MSPARASLFVLGSGGFEPAGPRARNPSGYALRLKGETLLFDLGFGCFRQLFRCGLDPADVSHAFFTHRHPDHVGDLPALLFHLHCGRPPMSGRLRLYGPRGFAAFFERLKKAHHPWLRPRGYELSAVELEEKAVVRGRGFTVACREVPHTTEALAFRLDSAEGSLCLSGDTAYDEGLAAFAGEADVFVVECSLGAGRGERSEPGHLSVAQALSLGRRSRARRVILSHLCARSERELRRRVLRPGRERIAEDLMEIALQARPRRKNRP
ncbi:MAG: ribonuclease Z [Elusimicrobia bacterium]|nr:ribonuclease Z [Elusimicrobiota bacterium]